MEYTPRWLTASSWEEDGVLELDADALPDSGSWPQAVREALGTARRFGLPPEAAMFHPSAGGAPFTAVSGLSGDRCWMPGGHDAQPDPGHHVSEYALDDGRVLLPDPSLPGPRFVNSSLIAFPDALDPPAFAMDTWWGRVHEEVGLDVIRPAPPGPAAAPRARPHGLPAGPRHALTGKRKLIHPVIRPGQ